MIKNNTSRCPPCAAKHTVITSRNNGRPSYPTLKNLLETKTYQTIANKYKVSRPCIVKWLQLYEKHGLVDE